MNMLNVIDVVTKFLQTHGRTLADCRMSMTILIGAIKDHQHDRKSLLNQCNLGQKYISPTESNMCNPSFESAVVKIQNGLKVSLTREENLFEKWLEISAQSKETASASV